jgi:hypothetical protein
MILPLEDINFLRIVLIDVIKMQIYEMENWVFAILDINYA